MFELAKKDILFGRVSPGLSPALALHTVQYEFHNRTISVIVTITVAQTNDR